MTAKDAAAVIPSITGGCSSTKRFYALLAAVFCSAALYSEEWARPDLVAKVESGELNEAEVSWWGFDAEDSTRFLKAAISSKAGKVVVDRREGPWYTLPLEGRSDLTFVIPEGVVLCAKRGGYSKIGDCLLKFTSATNVVLTGGGTLKMWFEDYTNKALYAWSEWRMGLSLLSCKNVTVENLRISDSGGDGIYLGERRDALRRTNEDVTIRNVVLTRHNRQAISVISADRLLIENCVMADTCGTPPMAGIDFEPNGPTEMLRDITVRNCVLRGNLGSGFDFSVGSLNSLSPDISITVENCVSMDNRNPLRFNRTSDPINGFRGSVVFRNCVFDDKNPTRSQFIGEGGETLSVKFENCMAADPSKSGELDVLGGDCGWNAIPRPSWSDGTPVKAAFPLVPEMASARIEDSAPGRMVRFRSVYARGASEYILYADSARTVRFLATLRSIWKRKFQKYDIRVETMDGQKVAYPKPPTTFDTEHEIAFRVPEKGFYRMYVRMGSGQSLNFTGSDVPIALTVSSLGKLPGFNGHPGELFVNVPEKSRNFAVFVMGGSGAEYVRVRVEDSKGVCMWDRDEVNGSDIWFAPPNPVSGVWKISFLKASKGCLDDYYVGVLGLPCWLFLSPEKTWR